MKISENGVAFVAAHEGFVSKAYLDSAGVLTIGYGFTMRSAVFAAYWRAKVGRALKRSDTITRAEADEVLARLIAEEYEIYARKFFGDGLMQTQFDAVVSVVYNLGPRSLKWKWAAALRQGDVAEAARRLRTTGTTAGGRKLAGLVNRRADEAALLQYGEYGLAHARAPGSGKADVREAQTGLKRLGFDPGSIDGWAGEKTKAAVLAYQRQHPDLIADGIVGPATMAQIRADLTSLKKPVSKVIATVAAASSGGGAFGVPWIWVAGIGLAVFLVAGVFAAWLNRDAISRLIAVWRTSGEART
ncbi:peptidoglycan-binding protein [uncultured Roseibium sp.]|uniref:glycoside hydrolase family protein n=1 Tax=uncultured Roseibium sp. TaxID=1936171 RepID=UPI0025954EFA|nr:peptidoglycan-binding protein [uncultured Roseibium sp.]